MLAVHLRRDAESDGSVLGRLSSALAGDPDVAGKPAPIVARARDAVVGKAYAKTTAGHSRRRTSCTACAGTSCPAIQAPGSPAVSTPSSRSSAKYSSTRIAVMMGQFVFAWPGAYDAPNGP